MDDTSTAAPDGVNHRRYGRQAMRLAPAIVVQADNDVKMAQRVRLVDLSQSGAQVLATAAIAAGSSVWLRLTDPRRNEDILLQAEVVWAQPLAGRWRAGLRFQSVSDTAASALGRWLFSVGRRRQNRFAA